MQYAHTIAMAQELLADGRSAEVTRMLEPLVGESASGDSASQSEQAMLRALLAQVRTLRHGAAPDALELLQPFATRAHRAELSPAARAAVACWMGWACAWRDTRSYDGPRALALLDEARHFFESELDTAGTCWALLGQSLAYSTIDEFSLMQQTLHRADELQARLNDRLISAWMTDLRILTAAYRGAYDDGFRMARDLVAEGDSLSDPMLICHGWAYASAFALELGHPAKQVIEDSRQALRAAEGVVETAGYPLIAALRAEAGAMIRSGDWAATERLLDTVQRRVRHYATASLVLGLEYARLDMVRSNTDAAGNRLEELSARLPHFESRLLACRLRLAQAAQLRAAFSYDTAREAAREALRHATRTGHRVFALRSRLSLAQTAVLSADIAEAERLIQEMAEDRHLLRILPIAADWYRLRGRLADVQHDPEEAAAWHRQALATYVAIGDKVGAARQKLAVACHSPADASSLLEGAANTFRSLDLEEMETAISTMQDGLAVEGEPPSWDATLMDDLSRAALSPVLVAHHVHQAMRRRLPSTDTALYSTQGNNSWKRIGPTTSSQPASRENGLPPSSLSLNDTGGRHFAFATTAPDDDDAFRAMKQIEPWKPVLRLALTQSQFHPVEDTCETCAPADPPAIPGGLVVASSRYENLLRRLQQARQSHSPILLTGEPGVGKRTLARYTHEISTPNDAPFITVDCTNVEQEHLGERLFGPTGSTGNGQDSPSAFCAFEEAHGGTLVLHRIELLPRAAQSRLLFTLNEGLITPPGSADPVSVDVRIIATSTVDAEQLRAKLDRDLFYRLSILHVAIPPLRERREEIPLLVRHFLRTFVPETGPIPTVNSSAMRILREASWPGNIRQLRNEVERAADPLRNEPAPMLDASDLSETLLRQAQSDSSTLSRELEESDATLADALESMERSVIREALERFDGQVSTAANALGITRQGLYKKLERLDISLSEFRKSDSAPA